VQARYTVHVHIEFQPACLFVGVGYMVLLKGRRGEQVVLELRCAVDSCGLIHYLSYSGKYYHGCPPIRILTVHYTVMYVHGGPDKVD